MVTCVAPDVIVFACCTTGRPQQQQQQHRAFTRQRAPASSCLTKMSSATFTRCRCPLTRFDPTTHMYMYIVVAEVTAIASSGAVIWKASGVGGGGSCLFAGLRLPPPPNPDSCHFSLTTCNCVNIVWLHAAISLKIFVPSLIFYSQARLMYVMYLANVEIGDKTPVVHTIERTSS